MRGRLGIVLADGAAPARAALDAAWPGWDAGIEIVVAADGGARHAEALGLRVDRWVGDGDSIEPALLEQLARAGVAIERVTAEKDESDAELALLSALAHGVDEVAVIGGLGGPRIDHALSNVGLLGHAALAGRPLRLYDEHAARISELTAPGAGGEPVIGEYEGRIGDLVSLLPVGGSANGVTTLGLRYPLAGEPLVLGRTRGVSNVRAAPRARVTLESGRLLVIETPANLRP
ncbi:MAG TPA: thiamine diphosphokinase [Candidatus Dormibacteraeota bacterium]|nr:thiamine diphosphokinase [Candidatus Dormibacteraeota bacterium]